MNGIARGLFLAGFLVVLVGSALVFNFLLVEWRLAEIDTSLAVISSPEERDRSSAMLGRMELLKLRADQGEESDGNGILEARLQTIAAYQNFNNDTPNNAPQQGFASPFFREIVNLIRISLGKEALRNTRDDTVSNQKLQLAYLWERARKYSTAITLYQNVDSAGGLSLDAETNLHIHLGYCLALDSKRNEARQLFRDIVQKRRGTEPGDLAQKMLFYIDYFEARLNQDNADTADLLVKGRREFFLAEYASAATSLRSYLDSDKVLYRQEGLYYLGRSVEEAGSAEEAELSYRKLILIDRASEWANQAYRRLYFLGGIYAQKPALVEEAKSYLEASGQSAWIAAVSSTTEIIQSVPHQKKLDPETGTVAPTTIPPPADSWVLLDTDVPGTPISVDSEIAGKTPLFLKVEPASIHKFEVETSKGKTSLIWHAPENVGFWERVSLAMPGSPTPSRVIPLTSASTTTTTIAVSVTAIKPKSVTTLPPINGLPLVPPVGPYTPQSRSVKINSLQNTPSSNAPPLAPSTSGSTSTSPKITPLPPATTTITPMVQTANKSANIPAIISFSLGGVSLGALGVSLVIGNQNYSDYKSATNTADITRLHNTLNLQQGINIAASIVGGLGVIGGIVFLLAENNIPSVTDTESKKE